MIGPLIAGRVTTIWPDAAPAGRWPFGVKAVALRVRRDGTTQTVPVRVRVEASSGRSVPVRWAVAALAFLLGLLTLTLLQSAERPAQARVAAPSAVFA